MNRMKAVQKLLPIKLVLLAVLLLLGERGWPAEIGYRYVSQTMPLAQMQKSVEAVQLNQLPELGPPTAADLAETPDIKFTDRIRILADALGKNPVSLYNFVHDYIEMDIYFGSLKGADGCLQEARGNDFDQASLLIALLRYHGIPARYEFGTLRLTLEQAQELALTRVDLNIEDHDAINSSLSSLGIPAVMVLTGDNKPIWMLTDQCWVRAYVPSTNYRGHQGGDTASDWVYLYPALKRHEYIDPQVDLAGKVLFSPDDYFQNAPVDVPPVEYYRQKVFDYIAANNLPCPTLQAAMLQRNIIRDALEVLPVALPAQIVTGGQIQNPVTWSEIPAAFRHKLRIRGVYSEFGFEETDFQTTVSVPESYGKKIGRASCRERV